ncbi:MAG: hypothetical protein WBE78_07315 [Candidatus Binataceae bacterium]|jgi:hypothetical protein
MEKFTLTRISKIAIAIGFSVALCGAVAGSAFADDHGGGRRPAAAHGGDRGHARGGYSGPGPAYYYAPAPNYYVAPEPDYYSYPDYAEPAPPPEGINLFFGL